MADTKTLSKEFQRIPNVGPKMAEDLIQLGVTSTAQLAKMDPDDMYDRMCAISGARQDPCVWDTYAAIVDYAQTSVKKNWWDFTAERKKRWAKQGRK